MDLWGWNGLRTGFRVLSSKVKELPKDFGSLI